MFPHSEKGCLNAFILALQVNRYLVFPGRFDPLDGAVKLVLD